MRVALTGADGMLGHALQKVFSNDELIRFTVNDFDITDLDAAMKTIRSAKPDFLIHAAGITDVDGCEADPEKAYLVNGIGARNIAMSCEEVGCPVMLISTDYVFDGTKEGPYDEWDLPNPLNRYGLSKLMAEEHISTLMNRFYIVRTSWLYGNNGRNFVDTILSLLSEREHIDVVNDQFGSPTFTDDLAAKLKELLGRGYGIYHITNSEICSWHEFAVTIAGKMGIKKRILPVSSGEYPRPARRPKNSALNNTMLKLEGLKPLRHWSEALEEYLRQKR